MTDSTTWYDAAIGEIARHAVCGYGRNKAAASEPTALAALALLAGQRISEANESLAWLARVQRDDGSVPVYEDVDKPAWTTCLAMLTWTVSANAEFHKSQQRATRWLLSIEGETFERPPELGHNTQLAGWPWIEGTHSWIEPTALSVVALKAADRARHPRTREAVDLLFDRQLPTGGCNCGNTIVLGQAGLPHVQPSGMAMLALAGEPDRDEKIARGLNYLSQVVERERGTASLCWAYMGLAAHDRPPANLNKLLHQAFERVWNQDRSPHKLSLLVLASLANRNPLIEITSGITAS